MIQASYSVGYAGSILFVSHFAEKSHKPRWVAAGAAAVAISCLLPLLPHFALWLPAYRDATSLSQSDNGVDAASLDKHAGLLCQIGGTSAASFECPSSTSDAAKSGVSLDPKYSSSNEIAYVIFAVASAFAGLGNSPLNTVGMTYIDENVPKQDSAFYMGIPMSMFAVGPVLGFFFHAYIMQFHAADAFFPMEDDDGVNGNGTTSTTIKTTKDPDFVGAWWISYLIVGCTISCLAGLALLFPRRLQTGKRRVDGKDDGEEEEQKPLTSEKKEDKADSMKEKNGDVVMENGGANTSPSPSGKGKHDWSVETVSSPTSLWVHVKSLLKALFDLLTNPVYLSTLVDSACFSTGKVVKWGLLMNRLDVMIA